MKDAEPIAAPHDSRRPRRWRRILRRVFLGLLAVLVALLLTHPFWLPVSLEQLAPPIARSLAGLRVTLDVERANMFGVEVSDLRVLPEDADNPLTGITLQHGRVDLALGGLFSKGGLGAIERVRLRGLDVRIDLTRLEPGEDGPGEPFALPRTLPPIEVTNASLDLRFTADENLTARSLNLELREDGEGRVASRRIAGEIGETVLEVARAELRFAYDDARVAVHSLVVDEQVWLGPSWVDLSRVGYESLTAELEVLALGGKAQIDLELGPDAIDIRVDAEGLSPDRVPAVFVPDALSPLAGEVDLAGELHLVFDALLTSTGRFALRLDRPSAAGVRLGEVEAVIALANGTLVAESVRARQGENRLHVADASLRLDVLAPPEGEALDALSVILAARGSIDLVVADPSTLLDRLDGVLPFELPPQHHPRIELEADLADGRLAVRRGLWDAPASNFSMGIGRIDLTEPANPRVDIDLSFAVEDLGGALAEFVQVPARGSVSGVVLLRGRWPEVSGEVQMTGSGLAIGETPIGELDVLAEVRRGRIDLRRFLARSATARVEGRGSLGLPEDGSFDLNAMRLGRTRFEIEADDLAALHPSLPAGNAAGWIEAQGTLAEPAYAFELEGGLPEGAGPAVATGTDAEVQEIAQALRSFAVRGRGDGERLHLGAVRAEGDFGSVVGRGAVTFGPDFVPTGVDLEQLELKSTAQGGDLVLTQPARIEFGEGGITVVGLELGGSLGSLSIDGRLDEGRGRMTLLAEGLTVDAFVAPLLRAVVGEEAALGAIDARLTIDGTSEAFELRGEGLISGARFEGGPPLDLDWSLDLREGRAGLRALLTWPDGALRTEAVLPFAPFAEDPLGEGELDVTLELGGGLAGLAPLLARFGIEAAGVLDGTLVATGPWDAVAARLELAGELVSLRSAGFAVLPERARLDADLGFGGEPREDTLRLVSGSQLEIAAKGNLGGALDVRALVAGDDAVLERALEARVQVTLAELGEVIRALESQGLERQLVRSGKLAAEVTVSGTLGAPEVEGRAMLAETLVRLGPTLPPLRNVAGTLRVVERNIVLENLTGEIGGSEFLLAGSANLDEERGEYGLDLTLAGKDLLIFRERGVQVRADADLTVKGFLVDGLAIGGKLTLSDGRFARNIELVSFERDRRPAGVRGFELFSFREPPASKLRFDVEVTSRAPFVIDNNALTGGVRPQLRLQGTGEVPVLIGTVFLDPTRVSLPSGTLRIESGVIQFEAADPFVPKLALNGGMRLRGYDIQVTVQGPYDAPEIVLNSSPPLSERALLILVLSGELPPDEEGSLAASSASRSVALFLARDFLTRWFDDESVEDDDSLLDRFEIITGRDVTRTGSETVEASFRVAEEVLRSNDALFLHGERDVYDEFNYGLRLRFKIR